MNGISNGQRRLPRLMTMRLQCSMQSLNWPKLLKVIENILIFLSLLLNSMSSTSRYSESRMKRLGSETNK